jgi:hypothetical protein
MTTEEKQIAIAKACRFSGPFGKEWLKEYGHEGEDVWAFSGTSVEGERNPVPNYPADLNAMHAAEQTLLDRGIKGDWRDYDAYRNELVRVVGEDCVFNCNAEQRANAFIYVMKLGSPYEAHALEPAAKI